MHRLVDLRAQRGEPGGCVLPVGRCHAEALRAGDPCRTDTPLPRARQGGRAVPGRRSPIGMLGRGAASPADCGKTDQPAHEQHHAAWFGDQREGRAGDQRVAGLRWMQRVPEDVQVLHRPVRAAQRARPALRRAGPARRRGVREAVRRRVLDRRVEQRGCVEQVDPQPRGCEICASDVASRLSKAADAPAASAISFWLPDKPIAGVSARSGRFSTSRCLAPSAASARTA